MPDGPNYSDCECATFWQYNSIPVGFGNTPEEAYKSLCLRLEKETNKFNADREKNG
jgi:hypothetical protein